MLACALFNEQNKGPILLGIIGKTKSTSENGLFLSEKKEKKAPHFKLPNGPVHVLNSQSF